ncbi:DUF4861 family protein [Gaetbulibacter sp. M240]|uniref:DUF4861 family protein n=1 Tax=Gaetbulibacter sp. M240 TaxID=3126511 RepID=UPI00374FC110
MRFKVLNSWFLLIFMSIYSCGQETKNKIIVENTGTSNYLEKVVSLKWDQVLPHLQDITVENFKIINSKTNQEIPYQIEKLGGETPENLLVQVSLKAGEMMELRFLNEPHGPFKIRTYGRYVPERYDDFAWENDKIGFRTFGKALEKVPNQNANGFDVWVKRTDTLIIDKRYARGKYHQEHGDGLDYYKVGLTLGAGNCAPYVNDSIWYSKNYTDWKLLDNGPLRTTFTLTYDYWNVDGIELKASKTISLDAGSQLNKITVKYSDRNKSSGNIALAVGIVKRPQESFELMDEEQGILGYWEPTHGEDGTTGVGIIFASKADDMKLEDGQFLAIKTIPLNEPFVYFTGAAWDKAGKITNHNQWFNYLKAQREHIQHNNIIVRY